MVKTDKKKLFTVIYCDKYNKRKFKRIRPNTIEEEEEGEEDGPVWILRRKKKWDETLMNIVKPI